MRDDDGGLTARQRRRSQSLAVGESVEMPQHQWLSSSELADAHNGFATRCRSCLPQCILRWSSRFVESKYAEVVSWRLERFARTVGYQQEGLLNEESDGKNVGIERWRSEEALEHDRSSDVGGDRPDNKAEWLCVYSASHKISKKYRRTPSSSTYCSSSRLS